MKTKTPKTLYVRDRYGKIIRTTVEDMKPYTKEGAAILAYSLKKDQIVKVVHDTFLVLKPCKS